MELGAFSVSLAVKDLEASRAFYAKFGFERVTEPNILMQISKPGVYRSDDT